MKNLGFMILTDHEVDSCDDCGDVIQKDEKLVGITIGGLPIIKVHTDCAQNFGKELIRINL